MCSMDQTAHSTQPQSTNSRCWTCLRKWHIKSIRWLDQHFWWVHQSIIQMIFRNLWILLLSLVARITLHYLTHWASTSNIRCRVCLRKGHRSTFMHRCIRFKMIFAITFYYIHTAMSMINSQSLMWSIIAISRNALSHLVADVIHYRNQSLR